MARDRRARGGSTPATTLLERLGVDHTPRPFDPGESAGSYGERAAEVLGEPPERVFKTLVVDLDDELVVVVVPVAARVDLKAVARALGGKRASMADPAAAERETGYVVGGISPFGQKRAHRTVVDGSAVHHPTVLVSGGRRGLDIELAPGDLVAVTTAVVAEVTRD